MYTKIVQEIVDYVFTSKFFCKHFLILFTFSPLFFKLGFTQCKAEQPLLPGIKLQKKGRKKDEKHTGKLFKKSLQIKGVC